jgi:hypothetical protein
VLKNPKLFNISSIKFKNIICKDKSLVYFSKFPIKSYYEDFYSFNKYTRNSYTMELSSSLKRKNFHNFLIANSIFN